MHSTHSTNLLFGAGLVLRRGRFVFVCMCFFLIAMLVGCSTPIKEEGDAPDGPDYVKWIPKTFNGPVNESLPRPKEHWWKDFGSTELDGLVDTALTNNYELRVAVARVAQTRAQANIVRAAQSPTVDLTAGYKNQAPGQGVGYAATTDDWGSQPVWQAGLAVNYELDLWGKKGFNSQAAYSLALASEFNREAVALSLISDVVTVYFQVMALTERIAVGERNLDTIRMVGRNLQRRLDRGDSTLIDVSQQLV